MRMPRQGQRNAALAFGPEAADVLPGVARGREKGMGRNLDRQARIAVCGIAALALPAAAVDFIGGVGVPGHDDGGTAPAEPAKAAVTAPVVSRGAEVRIAGRRMCAQ